MEQKSYLKLDKSLMEITFVLDQIPQEDIKPMSYEISLTDSEGAKSSVSLDVNFFEYKELALRPNDP